MIFIAHLIACSTCFGQYYAKAPNTTGSDHLYNTLELLMMGIVLPETCRACNKICNKYHLLHLAGILFPHNNDDARSESLHIHQTFSTADSIQIHERGIQVWKLLYVRYVYTSTVLIIGLFILYRSYNMNNIREYSIRLISHYTRNW